MNAAGAVVPDASPWIRQCHGIVVAHRARHIAIPNRLSDGRSLYNRGTGGAAEIRGRAAARAHVQLLEEIVPARWPQALDEGSHLYGEPFCLFINS